MVDNVSGHFTMSSEPRGDETILTLVSAGHSTHHWNTARTRHTRAT